MDALEREKVEIEGRLDGLRKGKGRMVSFFSFFSLSLPPPPTFFVLGIIEYYCVR